MKRFLEGLQSPIVNAAAADTQARGDAAEALAARFLSDRGVRVLARKVRCRGGEIDLIAQDGETVVFVEVRLRSNARFGGSAASISGCKRRRIIHAASWWLAGAGKSMAHRPCRFDAILMSALDVQSIQWLQGAFDAD
jgi:putative endonuclease